MTVFKEKCLSMTKKLNFMSVLLCYHASGGRCQFTIFFLICGYSSNHHVLIRYICIAKLGLATAAKQELTDFVRR